jgi:hypothetical protein
LRTNGIAGLSSARTGSIAVVSYETTVYIQRATMFDHSSFDACFSDRIDLAAVPPTVVHREIRCRAFNDVNSVNSVNSVTTLVPVAPR